MTTPAEIKADIADLHDSVANGFTTIQGKVDALKAQVAAGGTITEAQLDEVKTAIDDAKADLVAKENAVG